MVGKDFMPYTVEVKDDDHLFWLSKLNAISERVVGMNVDEISDIVDLEKAWEYRLQPSHVVAEVEKIISE